MCDTKAAADLLCMNSMNPGDSCDSEAVPGPTNDVNGSNLESRRDAAAARLENGSNHVQVEKSDIDRSEKDPCPPPPTTKPIPVQIRLISREGEEKSIQKQVGINCQKKKLLLTLASEINDPGRLVLIF